MSLVKIWSYIWSFTWSSRLYVSDYKVVTVSNFILNYLGFIFRQGGGIGTGDIRKMAYFEQSIDPQNLVVQIQMNCASLSLNLFTVFNAIHVHVCINNCTL